MEMKKKKNLDPVHQNTRSTNPSFSSTLLESIYRSIDEKPGIEKPESPDQQTIMSTSFYHPMKKHNFSNNSVAVLSNSNSNSSSSSSESSFWSGGLSSSDSESAHKSRSSSSSSSCYSMQRPKPIRTERSASYGPSKNNHEHDKAKVMSKALKIYNELKKQPISPGGKLSIFLNSLFAHPKNKPDPKKPKNKPDPTPNCSSASSYTRSCLSKTPSSKLSSTGSKRSVRFFPVSIIVGEDSQPCGQKKLMHGEDDDEFRVVRVMEENRKAVEAAKKLLESYRKPKNESYGGIKTPSIETDFDTDFPHLTRAPVSNGENPCQNPSQFRVFDSEDDDDGMSCASSDLFELNNLSDIRIGRYSEELPVYETTHVDTNRAIANGLIA